MRRLVPSAVPSAAWTGSDARVRGTCWLITINRLSLGYAKSLVASTTDEQLVDGRIRRPRSLTTDRIR